MANLSIVIQTRNALKERLLAQYPDLAEDEQALFDTLDGLDNLNDILVATFESAEEDKLMAEAIKARIEDLHTRMGRLAERAKAKRSLIAWAMQETGNRKIEHAMVTLSLRAVPPSVIVTDEAAIPRSFFVEKVVASLDKKALKEALEAGTVQGAELSNGSQTLAARTK